VAVDIGSLVEDLRGEESDEGKLLVDPEGDGGTPCVAKANGTASESLTCPLGSE
jgi:hypothetical protein